MVYGLRFSVQGLTRNYPCRYELHYQMITFGKVFSCSLFWYFQMSIHCQEWNSIHQNSFVAVSSFFCFFSPAGRKVHCVCIQAKAVDDGSEWNFCRSFAPRASPIAMHAPWKPSASILPVLFPGSLLQILHAVFVCIVLFIKCLNKAPEISHVFW